MPRRHADDQLPTPRDASFDEALGALEAKLVRESLERSSGAVGPAAMWLRTNRGTLKRLMERHGLTDLAHGRVGATPRTESIPTGPGRGLHRQCTVLERKLLEQALARQKGDRTMAAFWLGMNRRRFDYLLLVHGLGKRGTRGTIPARGPEPEVAVGPDGPVAPEAAPASEGP